MWIVFYSSLAWRDFLFWYVSVKFEDQALTKLQINRGYQGFEVMSARCVRTYDMCDLGGKNVEGKHFKRINEKMPYF